MRHRAPDRPKETETAVASPVRRDENAAYESFVAELAAGPGHAELLGRLVAGHVADDRGWCAHPSHSHRWEAHPCPVVRLARLVERAAARRRSPARRGAPRAAGPRG